MNGHMQVNPSDLKLKIHSSKLTPFDIFHKSGSVDNVRRWNHEL